MHFGGFFVTRSNSNQTVTPKPRLLSTVTSPVGTRWNETCWMWTQKLPRAFRNIALACKHWLSEWRVNSLSVTAEVIINLARFLSLFSLSVSHKTLANTHTHTLPVAPECKLYRRNKFPLVPSCAGRRRCQLRKKKAFSRLKAFLRATVPSLVS